MQAICASGSPCWIIATGSSAACSARSSGGILPFDTTGIDFAMTSLFTVIFVEQWQSTKCHIPALMGLAAAAVSLAILGPDNFILPAMLAICVMLVAMRGRLAKEVA